MDQEAEQTKGRWLKGQQEEIEEIIGGSRDIKLREFDGAGSNRTGFGKKETVEGSPKVIKSHSEYHHEGQGKFDH